MAAAKPSGRGATGAGSRPGMLLRRRRAGRAPGQPVSSRPAAAARPRTARPTGRRRGPALTARGVALLVVALVCAGSVLGPLRAWADQRSDLAALQSDIDAREQRVADLQAESQRWDDPAYVAAQARGRLHYVMPGETGYRVLGAPAAEAPPASGGAPVPTATATPSADEGSAADGGSFLQRLRSGLGLASEPASSQTPTPADIAPSTPGAAAPGPGAP